MLIIRWPYHIRSICNCVGTRERPCCVLFTCEACRASEVQLPTHCPGIPMSEDLLDSVTKGVIDYDRHKGWFKTEKRVLK